MSSLSVETELALLKAQVQRQQEEIVELRKRQGEVDKMKHDANWNACSSSCVQTI